MQGLLGRVLLRGNNYEGMREADSAERDARLPGSDDRGLASPTGTEARGLDFYPHMGQSLDGSCPEKQAYCLGKAAPFS